MKTVYIHGSNNGIRWVEDQGNNLSTSASEWDSTVRFAQHPNSEQDVYVQSEGEELAFSLSGNGAQGSLKAKAVELDPRNNQGVFLREESNTSQSGSSAGKRWHSGYVQRK